jgi:hypothetical protein
LFISFVSGLNLKKSRCLAAQEADEDRHRFFIGSSCLREENEIILVEFNEELVDSVCCVQTYAHPKEMFCLAPSPSNASLLFTVAGDGGTYLSLSIVASYPRTSSTLTWLSLVISFDHISFLFLRAFEETVLWRAPDADQSLDMDNKHDGEKTTLTALERLASIPEKESKCSK